MADTTNPHTLAEQAEQLLAAATPGPWYWHDYMKSGRTLAYLPDPNVHEMNVLKTTDDWPATRADEALIAAAPTLIAVMAAELRRLTNDNQQLTDAHQRLHDLFAGGPDTSCRTTWRRTYNTKSSGYLVSNPPVECVEVPLDDLRAAFADAVAVERFVAAGPSPTEDQQP